MELTVQEAATLLGVTRRAVRARIRRGTLRAFKRGNQWYLPRKALDLDPTQQRRLRDVSDEIRATVEGALPDRDARSVAELKSFRAAKAVLLGLRGHGVELQPAAGALQDGLGRLAEGHHQFSRAAKLSGYGAARSRFCHALAGLLVLDSALASGAARAIELEVLPPLAGLIRWAERLA